MTNLNHLPVINLAAGDHPETLVHLNCCPVTLNPLEPGDMLSTVQFDCQNSEVQLELTATAYGPIMYDGREVVEVHRTLTLNGAIQRKEVHWIGREEERIRCRLREVRPLSEEGSVDRLESIDADFPEKLLSTYEATRTVKYRQGNHVASEQYTDRVTGVFQVNVDADGFGECLCLETVKAGSNNRRVETYIQIESGLVVLARIFEADELAAVQIVRWN